MTSGQMAARLSMSRDEQISLASFHEALGVSYDCLSIRISVLRSSLRLALCSRRQLAFREQSCLFATASDGTLHAGIRMMYQ